MAFTSPHSDSSDDRRSTFIAAALITCVGLAAMGGLAWTIKRACSDGPLRSQQQCDAVQKLLLLAP